MTRPDLIDMVQRTQSYLSDPSRSDRDARAVAQIQLRAIEHGLRQREKAVPVGVVLRRWLNKIEAKTNP